MARSYSIEDSGTAILTTAEAKKHLKVDTTADDDYIDNLISAATESAQIFTNRYFINSTIIQYGDTWSDGGWKDDATTESVADSHDKEIPTGPDLSTHPKNEEITLPKVNKPDYSTFESVNDLVAERKLWEKENPGVRFPGQEEINKRLKENPNKWD